MENRWNRTNSTRAFPKLPLESVRNTESDSFVNNTGKGRWPKNVIQGQGQGPPIHLRQASSWDNQSGTRRDEVQSPFQPIEKPSTHSESPTGLHKPPPIAFNKWGRLHGFPDASDKEIETYFRPSLVKKVVRSQKQDTTKSPEVRNALSSNSIYERDTNALWKKMFPNTSDTAMHRIQFSSSEESCGEEFPSYCSSSDHTIVGRQSITTDHTVTEERLAALNVNGGPTSSSGSLRAPRESRDSLTSSSGSLCTAQLVSRSQTSEEDNYYMPSQNNFYQNPYSNINKTGVFPGGSLSTDSLYESTVAGPIGTSTPNSTPVSVGRTSGTMSTQSSLYSVTNDVMMRKNSPPPMPNETNGYLDKIQNEANNQTKHFAMIGSYYKQCYDHGKVCDVRFCVNDEILYAHKGALCSTSPYFETVFIENKQMNWKPMTEIRLRGLSIQSLKSFLNFVYTGSFEVTSSTILDLVKISRQFQVPVIRQRCLTKLATLPPDDLVTLLMAVRKDPMNDFMSPILRCISEKFLEISQRKSFKEMDLDTLIVVLSHDELVTSSEMDVFCAGLAWINASPDERVQYLETIMKYIRFPLMPQKDLVECIDKCNLLAASEKCLNIIFKANWIRTVMGLNRQDPLNLHMPDSRYLKAKENSNNSTNHINNNATPVDVMDISFRSIESYNNYPTYNESFTGSRTSLEQPSPSLENSERNSIRDEDFAKEHKTYQIPKPDLNKNSSMVMLDQKLYVIGGLRYNDNNPLPRRDVWVYSPEHGWRKLTSLRTARMHHALCVFDGCIYAIGGLGRNGRILKSVECYNPSTNSWRFVKSLSTPRAAACAAELNGNIFVAGGFGYSQNGTTTIFDSVECYHAFTDKWITKGSLRYGRCHATMTRVENSLYLSGGLAFNKNSSAAFSVQDVDLYNANNDSWTLRTYLDKARHSATSFASGNKMYLIGGLGTNTKENLHDDIECLDVQKSAWLSSFKLPIEVQWMKGLA